MPVDRFGKLVFRNPANRYAKPINRKLRKRMRQVAWVIMVTCLGLVALFLFVLILYVLYWNATH